MVEKYVTIASDFYRARYAALRARARTQNTFHSIPHDLRLVLGFYRSQKGGKIAELEFFEKIIKFWYFCVIFHTWSIITHLVWNAAGACGAGGV